MARLDCSSSYCDANNYRVERLAQITAFGSVREGTLDINVMALYLLMPMI